MSQWELEKANEQKSAQNAKEAGEQIAEVIQLDIRRSR